MADPHIQSPMDFWDYLTVILYRCGFVLAVPSVALLPYHFDWATKGVLLAAVLCAASLHIYLKHFRLLLQFATWAAAVCFVLDWQWLGLGAAFFTLGGLCFKEYFCFRVFGLNLQPLFLALLWLSLVMQATLAAQILSGIATLLLLILSIQKWRMPLHFDIGDKTKYQI
ncbi:hypothetical protein FHQ26_10815 [Testudinibacter sp. TR-2022]|uniref:DUF2301 domain-containing membrane protein n=1 Tax=Testudinibacter sp. TR-2022 TaxID=2585029 RepID=UPI001119FF9E|nr:DUF2301 domain-containing membrane protein [Testudinibacter sp. TR-2022]TNH02967.1 hypothetical protein FHQ22_09305 [Pasteurellaceae bacterium Phil31]TNH06249.1 hypothetical protein FHQ26_10815 [Testudinibacter sp. TR-2022]TNH08900.1 hypothetical protein FHQ25_08870 [Testudinibacter sp. TR-2022]TNH13301.1 hypothetical protein FIA56_08070 [Testudinibacter sp. TR-2022]TNH18108.1 hypothetical protein FHQ23_05980 [Testudinibacter sp. TR-2022]